MKSLLEKKTATEECILYVHCETLYLPYDCLGKNELGKKWSLFRLDYLGVYERKSGKELLRPMTLLSL